MAAQLNGQDGHTPAGRTWRVVVAPGTERDGGGSGPALVEINAAGQVKVDRRSRPAALVEVMLPRARLIETEDDAERRSHQCLISPLPDPRRAAAGVLRLEVVIDGWRFELDVESDVRARLRERATSARGAAVQGGPSELRAIIPGRVVSVDVAEGDTVGPGGRLLVLEAMKMQNELKAPRAGRVLRVAIGPGQTVELGDLLLVIE
jgi:biotin carboxyl carrier protein